MSTAYVVSAPNETKLRRLKWKAKEMLQQAWGWYKEHKEEIIVLTPIVVGGGTAIVKVVGKHINLHKQEQVKNLYCYDRSLGHYWKLRRELTNAEWLEIDRRRKTGERMADILAALKVLD